jgi:hypothetical protein
MDQADIDRFLSKVADEPEENGCIMWVGVWDTNGYGNFHCKGKILKAHRIAWEIANGPIPEGLHCCHSCDQPWCVNVKHLFLGTAQDNMRDRDVKGRHRPGHLPGHQNPSAVLSEDEAREILKLALSGDLSQREIGEMFGVSETAVWDIKHGRTWKHLWEEAPMTLR